MTPAEYAFLDRARVGRLATVDDAGRPHAVPICYAILEPDAAAAASAGRASTNDENRDEDEPDVRIVSAIDEKPKETRDLRRVRNVRANPRVCLLIDRYREDWARLAWVQVRGRARVRDPDSDSNAATSIHAAAVRALETKYDQYETHDLGERPIISIRVGQTVSWGALDAESDESDGRKDG